MKRKKKNKYLSEAQKRASERNWNKGLILGIKTNINNIHNSKTTPEREKMNYEIIINAINRVLKNWTK